MGRTARRWAGGLAAAVLVAALGGCVSTPRGVYTDESIATDVRGRLSNDDVTRVYVFSVDVEGGLVTIGGRVPNALVGRRALSVAQGTPGVRGVSSRLFLMP